MQFPTAPQGQNLELDIINREVKKKQIELDRIVKSIKTAKIDLEAAKTQKSSDLEIEIKKRDIKKLQENLDRLVKGTKQANLDYGFARRQLFIIYTRLDQKKKEYSQLIKRLNEISTDSSVYYKMEYEKNRQEVNVEKMKLGVEAATNAGITKRLIALDRALKDKDKEIKDTIILYDQKNISLNIARAKYQKNIFDLGKNIEAMEKKRDEIDRLHFEATKTKEAAVQVFEKALADISKRYTALEEKEKGFDDRAARVIRSHNENIKRKIGLDIRERQILSDFRRLKDEREMWKRTKKTLEKDNI